MITIQKGGDYYLMTCSEDEQLTIDRLQKKYPRKLELHIETYLKERKVNIREQENMLIMTNMTDEERKKRLKEIEQNNA